MTDADERLRALFAEDAPPQRDLAFTADAMAALARRRFLENLVCLAGLASLGGLALWGAWPMIAPLVGVASPALAPVAGALTLAAVAVTMLGGPVAAMLGLES